VGLPFSSVSPGSVRYWPFHGPLTALLDGDPDTVVVTETYPREFYQHFRSGSGGRGSKTKREDRLRWIPGLFHCADALGVTWGSDILLRVEAGFSDDINGEDEFDAVVGLLGMIGVVSGAIESGEPRDDPAVTSVEGWILGRRSTEWELPSNREVPTEHAFPTKRELPQQPEASSEARQSATADHDAPKEDKSRRQPHTSEEFRAPIEATLARLITIARALDYSDDDLIELFQRELLK
jgi:hypothetical protein